MTEDEKKILIETFVRNFILKDKRERCLQQLLSDKNRPKFTDELNHSWERIFDMRLFTYLDKNNNDYPAVKKQLNLTVNELCYIISDEIQLDNKVLTFAEAFSLLEFADFGTLIVNSKANKCYLRTEKSTPTLKLIGKKLA